MMFVSLQRTLAKINHQKCHQCYDFLNKSSTKSNLCRIYPSKYYSQISKNAPISMVYTKFDAPDKESKRPPLVIMHGLLGSRNNWKSLGRSISKTTGRDVYAVDARNHGDSPHTDALDYPLLGQDLLQFMADVNLSDSVLIGHSMGGRAVMAAALEHPDKVDGIIVLDISPIGVSEAISTLPRFVNIMQRVSIPLEYNISEGRKYVDELLKPYVPELGIRQFLLTNLTKEASGFKWKVNLSSIEKNFNPQISTFPSYLQSKSYSGKTTFIGGENSDYIKKTEHQQIQKIFPNAEFHYVPKAGHWLHADNPHYFIKLIADVLNKY